MYVQIGKIGIRKASLENTKLSDAYERFAHLPKSVVKTAWEQVNLNAKKANPVVRKPKKG